MRTPKPRTSLSHSVRPPFAGVGSASIKRAVSLCVIGVNLSSESVVCQCIEAVLSVAIWSRISVYVKTFRRVSKGYLHAHWKIRQRQRVMKRTNFRLHIRARPFDSGRGLHQPSLLWSFGSASPSYEGCRAVAAGDTKAGLHALQRHRGFVIGPMRKNRFVPR